MRHKFLLPDNSEIFLDTDDILRVEPLRDGCVVFLRNGQTVTLHYSAAYVRAFLPEQPLVTRPGEGSRSVDGSVRGASVIGSDVGGASVDGCQLPGMVRR